ncbi:hypothetical protein OQA88_10991 [Cercophora sp. LCS_1]
MECDTDDLSSFVGLFQRQNVQSVAWMKKLSDRVSELSKLYDDACMDLERERVAGRHAQEQVEKVDQSFRALKGVVDRNAFVLALVDADADTYLFGDRYYLNDPAGGGQRAAIDLRAAIRQHLQSVGGGLAGLPVVAKAFASGDGLAHLLTKAGLAKPAESPDVVSFFSRGFSQADDLFDFVLVGKGKDRADHKLMASFRQFAENPSCRHIFLAGCHDNGYVRMLEKYVHDQVVAAKVTLVKSFQVGTEFSTLPFQTVSFDAVFRSGPLGAPNSQKVRLITPQDIPAGSGTGARLDKGGASPPATYATRAASISSEPLGTSRLLPLLSDLGANVILLNDRNQRVDCALPLKSPSSVASWHEKTVIGKKRYCSMFHLQGSCSVSQCSYLHGSISSGEKNVLRHNLRAQKCKKLGECRDRKCYYGHHCGCSGQKCSGRFPAGSHGVDVSSWREVNVD